MKKIDFKSLTKDQRQARKRILEISFKQNLSHIGSCLAVVDLIDAVYKVKNKNDKFVLSNGHTGIALYTILEKYNKLKDKNAVYKLHVHPDRNPNIDIHVSSGSLGLGFPIAVGMALADKKRMIFCTISDGECAEGSVWETFRIISDMNIANIKTIMSVNGWGAYGKIETKRLMRRIRAFGFKVIEIDGHNMREISAALKNRSKKPVVIFAHTRSNQFSFLVDQHAHYYVMNEKDYNDALAILT